MIKHCPSMDVPDEQFDDEACNYCHKRLPEEYPEPGTPGFEGYCSHMCQYIDNLVEPRLVLVTGPGQIQHGDILVIQVGKDMRLKLVKAKMVLFSGSPKEEVVYKKKKNYYFITRMVTEIHTSHVKRVFRVIK